MKSDKTAKDHYAAWAKIWDENAGRVATAKSVAESIYARVEPGPEMTALDFGCGTGLLTMFMQPLLKHITAVDISGSMLEQLRQKIREQNISNVEPFQLNWETQPFPGQPFDLVFSSMTLHHIEDLSGLFKKFYGALKAGGFFCAADLYEEPGDFHSDLSAVAHLGFDPKQLETLLQEAGFADIRYDKIHTIKKVVTSGKERSFPVFIICAQKF